MACTRKRNKCANARASLQDSPSARLHEVLETCCLICCRHTHSSEKCEQTRIVSVRRHCDNNNRCEPKLRRHTTPRYLRPHVHEAETACVHPGLHDLQPVQRSHKCSLVCCANAVCWSVPIQPLRLFLGTLFPHQLINDFTADLAAWNSLPVSKTVDVGLPFSCCTSAVSALGSSWQCTRQASAWQA